MGELVSGVASALLGKLATKAYEEIALACGLKDDVEKLQKSMRIINALLMDAENKRANNDSIDQWLKQLRGAFDDATDILDEMEYQAKRNEVVKMYGSTSTKVRRFFSRSNNPLLFRIKMARKIRDVKQRIDEINSQARDLGIVKQHVNATTQNHDLSWRETASFVPPRVSGRNEEKEELISLLMGPQSQVNNIDVIPIVGIGGLGKTTLAQMVYNDGRVKEHFDMLMWVCVSDDFDVKRLLLRILEAAKKSERGVDPNSSLDKLQSLLHEELRGRSFLLVLDDVWNKNPNKWDDLRNHLLGASSDSKSKGSKIIVTTRSNTVVSIMGSGSQIKLEPLPGDECWKLFVKCAFQEEKEAEQYPWLKQIGEEVVKKCKGVPLAITTLGCLLKSKSRDANEWKKVRDSEMWEINPGNNDILPSLRLSYSHLSPKVKQCFSYCSLFPKDYLYGDRELIMYWMAHGLLQPINEKEEPENIGKSCIKELVSASLLQVRDSLRYPLKEFVDVSFGFTDFTMHDLVHDLAKSTMEESNKTRTIIREWQQPSSLEQIPNEFKYLKTLNLRSCESHLPDDCFAKMKHLRLLHLMDCSVLEKLPGSISNLQNLQSLVLLNCSRLQELPRNIRNLVSLQNLHIRFVHRRFSSLDIGCFKQLQWLYIEYCPIVSLPSALGCLTALKKLLIWGCPKLAYFEEEEQEGKQHVVVHDLNLQVFLIYHTPKLRALPTWLKRSSKTLQVMALLSLQLEALPEWLPNLTSLDRLLIYDCPSLSSLPNNMDQLRSLQQLIIYHCPHLTESYEEGTDPVWAKIDYVPHLAVKNKPEESSGSN